MAERLLPEYDREFLLTDLDEEFAARRSAGRAAAGWYVAQAAHASWTRRLERRRLVAAGVVARTGGRMFNALWSDALAGLRGFRRHPGAMAVVVLSLALGIGASAAMFTVVRGVLLTPLPYGDPDGIVTIWSKWTGFDKTWLSDQEVLDYQARSRTMSAVAAWDVTRVTLTGAGDAVRVGAAYVTFNAFDVFGVHPILGSSFSETEARAEGGDRPMLLVLSYGLWQRQFGGNLDVTSRTLEINGRPARILGVMPRDFQLPTDFGDDAAEPTQLWMPLYFDPAKAERGNHGFFGAGRLKAGMTPRQASDDLASIAAALTSEGQYTPQMHFTAFSLPVAEDILGSVRRPLYVLLGAVGFLMLIACANAAALLLARAESRQREFATRTALGASRWRLVRQQLAEGAMLACAGGLAGIGLALGAKRVLDAIGPTAIPRASTVSVDWHVVLFLVGACAVAAVLCSLPPAFRAFRVGLTEGLRDGGTQISAGGHRLRLRNTLVVLQLAFALLLLAGTGLTLRTLWSLQKIDLGFDPSNVLTARIALPARPYDTPPKVNEFFTALLTRVRALPGVKAAGIIRALPIGTTIGDWGMRVDGYTPPAGEYVPGDWQVATDGALEALGERLVRGRLFSAADTLDAAPVALVNETMARKYWAGRDAIGGRFKMGNPNGPWITVVGIIGDVRHNGVTAPIKTKFYRPYLQFSQTTGDAMNTGTIVVRTDGDPLSVAEPLRAATRALDPAIPLAAIRPMTEVVNTSLTAPRLTSTVFVGFAAVALALSAVGIYGLLVYLVSQRSHEIGIRVAIGAQRREIVRLVFNHGLRLAGIGIGTGLVLALLLTRTLAGLLYGVPPLDPLTFVVVPVILLGVALAAAFLPARRAAGVDPVIALKRL
jgi:putative ABC transport system permease protein